MRYHDKSKNNNEINQYSSAYQDNFYPDMFDVKENSIKLVQKYFKSICLIPSDDEIELIDGKKFNKMYTNVTFVKLSNQIGANMFEEGIASGKLFTFYKSKTMYEHLVNVFGLMTHMFVVRIPDNASVFVSKSRPDVWVANALVLKNKMSIWDNYKLCSSLVQADGMLLEYCDKSIIDEALCKKAIDKTSSAIIYVPVDLLTSEMWEEAYRRYVWISKHNTSDMISLLSLFYKPKNLRIQTINLDHYDVV